MSGLDAIRQRAKAYAEYGTPGLASPRDRAELLSIVDQLEAVVRSATTVHARLALRDDAKRILEQ